MNTNKIFTIAVAGTLVVWIAISVLPRLWMGYPPSKTSSARQAFEPVAAESAMTVPASYGTPISVSPANAGDEIDEKYAEQLYDVRFAIATARDRADRPDPGNPGTTDTRALEERLRVLLAEIDAKKAEARKKKLAEKPAAAETEPKR